MRRLLGLTLLSGAAGLIFETAWTRLYRDLFGETLRTTSAVIASFLLGLALGGALGALLAARTGRPLRWYGAMETSIALLVLTSPAQLWAADALLTASGDATRWLAAFLLLLLPTTAMGATLPLLVSAAAEIGAPGRRAVALLYGSNTLGAVAGVAGAGWVLLRELGVIATLRAGSALSLLAGLAALLLSKRERERVSAPAPSGPAGEGRFPFAAALLVFVSGFASLGWEVVWIRLFSNVLGSSILSFSAVVAVLLAAVAAGSLLAARLLAVVGDHRRLFGFLQLLLAVVPLVTLVPLYGGALSGMASSEPGRPLLVAGVVALPALLMGASFPAAVAAFSGGSLARDTGGLYAALTVGNVLGALAAGHLLVPRLGAAVTAEVLALASLGVAALVLATRVPRREALAGLLWCGVALLPASLAATRINAPAARARFFGLASPHARVLSVREGELGTVTVLEVPPLPVLADDAAPARLSDFGGGYRLIAVDGSTVAGTAPDLRTTQRMQAHIPLLLHGAPRYVLQIGYGSGETAREVARYTPERFDMAEINPAVIEESDRWFAMRAESAFTPFTVRSGDARDFVRRTPFRYDAILNDSTYPGLAGSSHLYSTDHFRACRSRLREGGIVSTWVPVDLPPEAFRTILASFFDVFPEASFWLPANCLNKHGVLVGTLEPQRVLLERFRTRPWPAAAAASLAELGYETPSLLESALVLDGPTIAALAAGAPHNSEDHPLLEYPARGHRIAGEGFWVETLELILAWQSPRDEAQRAILEAERSLLSGRPDEALRSLDLAAARAARHPGPAGLRQGIGVNRAQRRWGEAMERLSRRDGAGARSELEKVVSLAPEAAAPRYELGRILFEAGDVRGALPHLEKAVARARAPRHARLLLGDALLLTGSPAEAERQYRAYLETEEPRFEVLAALGEALLRQGRRPEARETLHRADAMRPGNATLRRMLAEAGAD